MQKNKLAQIYHFDSFWKRQEKYDRLNNTDFGDLAWKELELKEPYYFFVPKDFGTEEKYNKGFSVSEIFKEFNSWIQTKRDKLTIQFDENKLLEIKDDFEKLDNDELRKKYNIAKDWRDWTIDFARKDLLENSPKITNIIYRPFDCRQTLYTWKSKWFLAYPREAQSKYMLEDNLCLFTTRTIPASQDFNRIFVWKNISEIHIISDQTYFFPLYLYQQNSLEQTEEKPPNFNEEIIDKIEKKLKMKLIVWNEYFRSEDNRNDNNRSLQDVFSPEDLFDYIYAILHSKTYREKYKEFLKIDFPKIPFDVDKTIFFRLRDLWRELRTYHLMENENLTPKNFITTYPVDWNNEVWKVKYEDEEVFINDTQYFSWAPLKIWEFYIWGYQPAQKWLKDRKGRNLSYEDILHYSKIILCLKETMRIMEEIEKIRIVS